ncbi:hypothetical protein HXX76_015258 [Chlamydomonas incerta]|uniref:EF-hand domain-containing protein n=1 Tax=Chlamydomonas incerta TaxID=51695 RepID=A0A835SMQ6_CHLIN|nr:hypothetical protein HXX76_015258 [Chlamydomonas incerta]|eukprot:KAG2423510.1 hypothetical protein HXX76_015258 [Chlamydomonas incerta]
MVDKVAAGRSTGGAASDAPLRIKPVVLAATGNALPPPAPAPAAQLPSAASARKQVSVALPDPDDDIDVGPATRNHVDQTPKKTKPAQLKAAAVQAAPEKPDQDCDVAATATDAGTCATAPNTFVSTPLDTAAAAASGSPSAAEAPVSPLAGMNTRVPSKVVRNLSAPVLTLADIAGLLGRFTSGGSDGPDGPDAAAGVTAYLSAVLAGSKAQGAGLYEAARAQPEAGHVFAAAYNLAQVAGQVVAPCRDNGAMMAGLGQDVVRGLDAAGKKGCVPPREVLAEVAARLEACGRCLAVYAREGWLLHLACNESAKADLDRAHSAVAAALQAAPAPGLELPPGSGAGRPGAYLDMNRGLRRSLKTHGSGSVAAGLKAVGTDPLSPELTKLAALLGVPAPAVARELAALPADVPADVYYSRMVLSLQQQRNLFGSAAGADAAAALAERYRPIFAHYDKAGRGFLEPAELRAVLADLGEAGAGGPTGPTGPELERAFALADQDGDGRVSPEEFARYYDALTFGHARNQLRLAMGLQAENDLKAVFIDFASFGTRQQVDDMDSAHFAKLFRDCGLLGPDLTLTDIDLAFTAAKGKGERKLSFDAFLTALAACAERKGTGLEGLVRAILGAEGPLARATKADAVRLHDDRSTYTGVYAKGGPKVTEKAQGLAALLDRSDAASAKKTPMRASRAGPITIVDKPADKPPLHHTPPPAFAPGAHSLSMRLSVGPGGVPGASSASVSAGGAAAASSAGATSWKRRSTAGGSGSVSAPPASKPLYESWLMWQQFGAGAAAGAPSRAVEMGPAQYIKLLRETGIIAGKDFTAVQAELVYAKVKPQGCTKITFECFERALSLIAAAKGTSREALEGAITASGGPLLTRSKH